VVVAAAGVLNHDLEHAINKECFVSRFDMITRHDSMMLAVFQHFTASLLESLDSKSIQHWMFMTHLKSLSYNPT
jgi:hypothetical protein